MQPAVRAHEIRNEVAISLNHSQYDTSASLYRPPMPRLTVALSARRRQRQRHHDGGWSSGDKSYEVESGELDDFAHSRLCGASKQRAGCSRTLVTRSARAWYWLTSYSPE